MSKPKISVVIAAYNVEAYIGQCLDAINNQTFQDFEAIIVNDGSTDNTKRIITAYAKQYSQFSVLNKNNGGVSTARNAGLDKAQGEYIIFLDGDDYYESTLFEELHKAITAVGADIAVCNFRNYFHSMNKLGEDRINFSLLKENDRTSPRRDPDNIFNVPTLMFWNKLFRTEFLRQNNIRNDETLHRAQDIDAVGRALVDAALIAVVDKPLVYYRTDTGSSNVNRLYKYPYDVFIALENLHDYIVEKSMYDKLRKSYIHIAVDHALALLYFTETSDMHKKIFERTKKMFEKIDIMNMKEGVFSDERAAEEAHTLMNVNYEAWLQYRILHLRDDRESKYISYLLAEYQRKYWEEVALRESMEQSISWKVTKPIRRMKGMLK